MFAYIINRILQSFIVVIIITVIVFVIIRILPGDPILTYVTQQQLSDQSEEQIAQIRREFGLDKPIASQYVNWIINMSNGNFGKSIFYRQDVGKLMLERVPITLHLGLLSLIISLVIGIITGMISALTRGKTLDTVMTVLANVGITIPVFWLGILLIYLFGLKLRCLPVYGYTSPFVNFWLNTKQIILPVICLAIFPIASTARQTRSSMLEVIQQDYIRTARSKGLSERVLVLKHAVKNALIPVITLTGMSLSFIIGGSVLIETVFSIPGMGRLSVQAVLLQDYGVIQAITLCTAITVVFVNLIVDIAYSWLDPRIRFD